MSAEQRINKAFSFEKTCNVVTSLCEQLNISSELKTLIRSRDFVGIINFDLDINSEQYNDNRQAKAFFEKNSFFPIGVNTRRAAESAFLESEVHCSDVNARLKSNRALPYFERKAFSQLNNAVRRKIDSILGPVPDLDSLNFGFGPGSVVGVKRLTSVRRKLSTEPTITIEAMKYLPMLRSISPHWSQLLKPVLVQGGNYNSVPKNAKTDRSIIVEPMVNAYLQKGVGEYIRNCMSRVGNDLSSNQVLNQQMARQGSIDGSIATIDIRNASDTISFELVREFLPYEWFCFLDDIRSQQVKFNGSYIKLSKFSSMGNGFTFELESLIFYAIASTFNPSVLSVHGDDIVIDTNCAVGLIEALSWCGFNTNVDKTFIDGPFRESCGKDFLNGVLVRPCYLKSGLDILELFKFHNFFVRSWRHDLANFVLQFVPKRYHLFGPDGFGDGHLIGAFHRVRHSNKSYGGYVFRTYSSVPLVFKEELPFDWLAILYFENRKFGVSLQKLSQTIYYERGGSTYRMIRVYTY